MLYRPSVTPQCKQCPDTAPYSFSPGTDTYHRLCVLPGWGNKGVTVQPIRLSDRLRGQGCRTLPSSFGGFFPSRCEPLHPCKGQEEAGAWGRWMAAQARPETQLSRKVRGPRMAQVPGHLLAILERRKASGPEAGGNDTSPQC